MKLPIPMYDSLFNIKMVEKHKFVKVVNLYDILEISSAIRDLVNNREAYKEMGIKAFELYENQFDWKKQMVNLDEFYKKIMFEDR